MDMVLLFEFVDGGIRIPSGNIMIRILISVRFNMILKKKKILEIQRLI